MTTTVRVPASYLGCYRRHVDLQRVASAVCPA
ncbi:putative leader peptide [Actinomycetospora flava]|uniref:Leader peptide n=1 Tax=Actinomycetospora flava TaxID=3129232 RepID=A0ABU8M2J4_9PSEU